MGNIIPSDMHFPLNNHTEQFRKCQTVLDHPLNVWSNTQLSTADLTSSEARVLTQPGLN